MIRENIGRMLRILRSIYMNFCLNKSPTLIITQGLSSLSILTACCFLFVHVVAFHVYDDNKRFTPPPLPIWWTELMWTSHIHFLFSSSTSWVYVSFDSFMLSISPSTFSHATSLHLTVTAYLIVGDPFYHSSCKGRYLKWYKIKYYKCAVLLWVK